MLVRHERKLYALCVLIRGYTTHRTVHLTILFSTGRTVEIGGVAEVRNLRSRSEPVQHGALS
jgi:hypothetical protein